MRSKSENPVFESENYTFVSARTLRNTFPTIIPIESISAQQTVGAVPPAESDVKVREFTKARKRVSRRVSEPAT